MNKEELEALKRLVNYCGDASMEMVQAVYISPAQRLRSMANKMEQREMDVRIINDWIKMNDVKTL